MRSSCDRRPVDGLDNIGTRNRWWCNERAQCAELFRLDKGVGKLTCRNSSFIHYNMLCSTNVFFFLIYRKLSGFVVKDFNSIYSDVYPAVVFSQVKDV